MAHFSITVFRFIFVDILAVMETPKKSLNGLSLTDYLAIDRNKLANERTLLAYLRTSLAFLVAGISMIQFFSQFAFLVTGYILIPLSFIIIGFGIFRYRKVKKSIEKATKLGVISYQNQLH